MCHTSDTPVSCLPTNENSSKIGCALNSGTHRNLSDRVVSSASASASASSFSSPVYSKHCVASSEPIVMAMVMSVGET